MFSSGGTATTATVAGGTTQTSPSASAQAASPSAHGKIAGMVTTTVERDDGRTITRKERRCD
jgi:hypothetical protein